jgi:hypothetical protein
VTQHPIGGSLEDPRDVTGCTSLRAGSKGCRVLLTGLILIAAIASPATSTAYGAGSSIRLTADVSRELTNSPRPAPPASPLTGLTILVQKRGIAIKASPPPPEE